VSSGSVDLYVLAGVEEVELPEVLDHRLLHTAPEREVKLLQRLAGGKPGGADAALPAMRFPGGHRKRWVSSELIREALRRYLRAA